MEAYNLWTRPKVHGRSREGFDFEKRRNDRGTAASEPQSTEKLTAYKPRVIGRLLNCKLHLILKNRSEFQAVDKFYVCCSVKYGRKMS